MVRTESTPEVEVMLVVSPTTGPPWIDIIRATSERKVLEFSISKGIDNTLPPSISTAFGLYSANNPENTSPKTLIKFQLSTLLKLDSSKF